MLNIASTTEVMLRARPTNCEKADVNVNLDKTKVVIFNNSGKSLNNYAFKYGMTKLENAKSYRYL